MVVTSRGILTSRPFRKHRKNYGGKKIRYYTSTSEEGQGRGKFEGDEYWGTGKRRRRRSGCKVRVHKECGGVRISTDEGAIGRKIGER